MLSRRIITLFITGLLLGNVAWAGKFLPPDEAFRYHAEQKGNTIHASWLVEHGYYLYESRIYAYIEGEEENTDLPVTFSTQSVTKLDKNFGEVQVFYDKADMDVDISSLAPNAQTVTIEYQGCSKDGLCYQPQIQTVDVTFAADVAAATPAQPAEVAAAAPASASTTDKSSAPADTDMQSTAGISRFLEHAGLLKTIGIFLLLGMGLSLTPCILPMVPILSGIIVGHGHSLTARQGIILSSAYVLGMATSYAAAGMVAATFGAQGNLQAYMQNPWVISVFSLVFVALSLSMFGFYNLALPSSLQNRLNDLTSKQKGGHFTSVYVMGALSALVVSPCVSAPLAGALVFISSTGDMLMGGLALFALGIGMGMPLIAIGAGGGKLVPRAGMWMDHVKHFFGVVLLAVAIWLLSRIIPATASMLMWALLLIVYGVHSGALEPAANGPARFGKAASFIVLLYGCLLLVGGLSGASDPLKPLGFVGQGTASAAEEKMLFTRIRTSDELTAALEQAKAEGKPVMLDFYADWCTACIDMEKNVFSQPEGRAALAGFVLLQVDVTKNTKDDQAILNRFGLFGPPAMLFFRHGEPLPDKALQGELPLDAFVRHVGSI